MNLSFAYDALSDLVTQFHNEMLRQGVKELAPRQWAEEFRSWLDPYEFERHCEREAESLADYDRRHAPLPNNDAIL